MLTIYHNPYCQKSRQTLALIEKKGIKPVIVEYLKATPSEAELKELIRKLGIRPVDLVRKKETLFKEKFEKQIFSDAEWIKILAQYPVLIERPIVVKGNRAVIGRPPENVLTLL